MRLPWLWGETGRGKSTAISNVIGGMFQELGGMPTIRTTIPKLDADTAKIFPQVNWLGVPNSIFGLLEAALEIQYRIHLNEQAFLNKREIKDFEPILFFIDEINLVMSRWGKINEADAEDVLARFERTYSLSGERLSYFQQFMKLELMNYKSEFAKRLLLFIWQTGRSLKVKSLIAGQNLQPAALKMLVNDLANCAYIAFGDSITSCAQYKVRDIDLEQFEADYSTIQENLEENPSLKFVGLYCPTQGKYSLGVLPPPGYYRWEIRPDSLDISEELRSEIIAYFSRLKTKAPKTARQMNKNCANLQKWTESETEAACSVLAQEEALILTDKGYRLP